MNPIVQQLPNKPIKTIKIGAQKMIRSKKGITPHSDKLLEFNLSQ